MKTVYVRSDKLGRAAFTLIELMLVIGIIALLAALTMGTFTYAQRQAARNRTTATLASVTSALERYKTDSGEYPQPANATKTADVGGAKGVNTGGAAMLYQVLTGDGDDQIDLKVHSQADSKSDGVVSEDEQKHVINADYIPVKDVTTGVWRSKLSATLVTAAGDYLIIDGFGHPFFYEKNVGTTSSVVNPTYDIWSVAQGNVEDATLDRTQESSRSKMAVWIKNW